MLLFRLIIGAIDHNINISIFVYVPAQRFKENFFFHLKLPEGWMFSNMKISGKRGLRSRPRAAMFAVSFCRLAFHDNCTNSRALIGLMLSSISGQTHEFIIYAMWQRARAENLTVCYRRKQMDISFSCVCPVIDNEFCHNIVKVVCGSTRLSPRGSTANLIML